MKLAVLISGRGSNLAALLEARDAGRLRGAEFVLVLSNNPDAPGLDHARNRDIPTVVVDHRESKGDRTTHDRRVLAELERRGAEAVVLAGYMRIVGPVLLEAFPRRIMNIHPSLLPSFRGLHAQRQAIEWGVRVSGCTVHLVDDGVDSGPIIVQRPVPVLPTDTEEDLAARILEEEHVAYVEALEALVQGRLRIEGRTVTILSSAEATS